jgi:hypothetical protein
VDAAYFLERAPEFLTINPDPTQAAAICQQELDDADDMLSDTAFGKARNLALALVAAHRLAIRYKITVPGMRNPATPGVLAGQGATTGGLNQQLAHSALVESAQAWRADYSRTNYGLQYLGLLDRTITPAMICGRARDDEPPSGDIIPWVFP